MKNPSLLITSLFIASFAFAQNNSDIKQTVATHAQKLGKGFVAKDYRSVIKYIHPTVVEGLGGEDKMLQIFADGLPGGTEIKGVEFSHPSDTVISEGEIQCTLTQTITLKTKERTIRTTSSLIAMSPDEGETWYFLDANRPFKDLKQKFPNLSDRLVIQKPTAPVLIDE